VWMCVVVVFTTWGVWCLSDTLCVPLGGLVALGWSNLRRPFVVCGFGAFLWGWGVGGVDTPGGAIASSRGSCCATHLADGKPPPPSSSSSVWVRELHDGS